MRLSGLQGRILRALVQRGGHPLEVVEITSRPWASATFTGARHRFTVTLKGPGGTSAADRLCDGIEDAEFDLGRDLLVDIAVVAREATANAVVLTIEALTVEAD